MTGERGPQGDHGQTGDDGERGATGRRGPSNWLAYLIMAVVVIVSAALYVTQEADRADDIQADRKAAIIGQCHYDQAQDEVLRALIRNALNQPSATGLPQKTRMKLAEQLLAPTGGLELTDAEADAQCDKRLERAGLG